MIYFSVQFYILTDASVTYNLINLFTKRTEHIYSHQSKAKINLSADGYKCFATQVLFKCFYKVVYEGKHLNSINLLRTYAYIRHILYHFYILLVCTRRQLYIVQIKLLSLLWKLLAHRSAVVYRKDCVKWHLCFSWLWI